MTAIAIQTLWTRDETPSALLLSSTGSEPLSAWRSFAESSAQALTSKLRARAIARFSAQAWSELIDAHRLGSLEEALGGAPLWRELTILTPPSASLPSESEGLIGALKELSIPVCLGDFTLTRPSIALLSRCAGAELGAQTLGRDLCSNLSLRLTQAQQWTFVSQIDSRGLFTDLAKLGCAPFSGDALFQRPMANALAKPEISVRKVLRLLNMAYAHADLSEIEEEIKQDAALSYKLISLINSAGLKTQRSVGSAREALMILGYAQLSQWLSLLLLGSGVASQSKSALRFALAKRAKLCELLAGAHGQPKLAERAFVCGLLSSMDALFDAPMSSLIAEGGLPSDISSAIESQKGALGSLLACAIAHERSAELASQRVDALGISPSRARQAHQEATLWALSTAPFVKL